MPSSTPLVLVADDEPSMLELVARHLRTMNDPKLEVIQASDGEEAWHLARQHLPDLVVLDVMMPGMSGWEVCRKIREDVALAHTGVVMLTGVGENLNQITSPLFGADAYIDKPFEFDDFDDKVRSTLRSREKQREGVERPRINGTAGAAQPAERREASDVPPSSKASKPGKARAAKARAAKAIGKRKVSAATKTAAVKAPKKTTAKTGAKKAVAKTVAKGAPKAATKVTSKVTSKPAPKGVKAVKAAKAGAKASAKKPVATKAKVTKSAVARTAKKPVKPAPKSAAKRPSVPAKKVAKKAGKRR